MSRSLLMVAGLLLMVLGFGWGVRGDDSVGATTRPAAHLARLNLTTMEDISGVGREEDGIRRRPWVPEDHNSTLIIEDEYVHDMTNRKGIFVTSTSTEKPKIDGMMPTFKSVIIRNCEVGPVTLAQAGLHIDAIKADGSVEPGVKPTLLIEDVFIHDTTPGVMTIICKDGSWDSITLRRVETLNVAHPVTIWGSTQYPQGDVLIDQCPGLRVIIQGDEGCVGTVTVRDSPGADVKNVKNADGHAPWSKIVVESTTQSATGAMGG